MSRCLYMRLVRDIFAALSLIAGLVIAGNAVAQQPAVRFDIPPQSLSSALIQFGDQSGHGVLASASVTDPLRTIGFTGEDVPEAVLAVLLTGTGLTYRQDGDVFVVVIAGQHGGELGSGPARFAGIEEVIVTGQKREERIQDVPIAISAFSMDALDQQKIEGGFDLLKAVPNVTFSKSNFSGYNFQIRGIGTQAISATTDPGVAVSFNNTTLIVNRLFEQEYLDIERVEVLRGPQGTLYGRNATAGVINVISAKPVMGEHSGELKLEVGNYNAQRMRGYINLPIGTEDKWALRAAFAMTRRDGYGTNLAANDPETLDFVQRFNRPAIEQDIDNRDLWTARFSLGWQPNDRFRANLVYERFEEDDRRMRSTKQLCHHDDGNVMLQALRPGADGTYVLSPTRVDDAAGADVAGEVEESYLMMRFRSQLSQGCLPRSLYAKGDRRSDEHGAYGTPNGNSSPFIRAGRGGSFTIDQFGASAPFDPDCESTTIVSNCELDPLRTEGGQSRDLRAIYSLINPRYRAQSELIELSFDYELGEGITLSAQTLYMENELYSTQDFLRYKTLPMFGDSSNSPDWRVHASPGGVVHDPQLGASDRLLMQDVSQQYARQFGQEFRLTSQFDGPLNFSVGANYTKFDTTTDYFVFINALTALAYSGNVYSGMPKAVSDLPSGLRNRMLAVGYEPDHLTLFSLPGEYIGDISGMTVGCGGYVAQLDHATGIARCIYVQPGSIEDVATNPEGHHFFMSRNPYALDAASLFGELYWQITPTLKFTAGLRVNWDRKTFTPVPSQTMLADWRGRQEGGFLGASDPALITSPGAYPPVSERCDPRTVVPTGSQLFCALGGLAENGRGYPAMPDMVQEWREPTGRLGIDWMLDTGVAWVDETLLYAFYTRGYKAGGANPPLQSAPSGLLLAAAQGAAAPPVFKAEYVNAFEIGTKNRLLGGAVTLNAAAFYYDYTDYQISKILDRSANNENVDATVWGLELEAMFAPAENTLLNASIGYLRTRIADGEQSLDLMDRTQGGNQHYVDPNWASVPCTNNNNQPINVNHLACRRGQVGIDDNGDPIQGYLYRDGFDHWVIVRPTLTQASSCVAPAVLIYDELVKTNTLAEDLLSAYCPGGRLVAQSALPGGYNPATSAPNGSAGFFADIGGNELPNAPRFTVSLGAQHSYWIPGTDWSATGRVDWYWQDKSYGRIYNTSYDRLRDWTNTNISFWISNDRLGLTIEAYVKNAFNEAPITGAFLNSDDTGLSTNIFTLDPRLVGLSIRKHF